MGLFSSFKNSGGGLFPGADNLDFSAGGTIQSLADPLDLFGVRAQKAADKSAAQQQAQFDKIISLYQPSVDAATRQYPFLEESATAEGYGNNIGDILKGGSLDPLIKDRQDAATNYMAARGLRRSGAAVREAANIPTDLAMQVEQELTRRRQSLAGQGQTGMAQTSNALNGIGMAQAGATLGGQQIQAQNRNNALGLIGGILGAFI